MSRRLHVWFLAAVFTVAGPIVMAGEDFDYSRTQTIYTITGDGVHTFARFPRFLEFRDVLTRVMVNAEDYAEELSPSIYTLEVVGVGERNTLFVGSDWISDGRKVASLDEDDFEWIEMSIKERDGGGWSPERLERSIEFELERQKQPGWRPDNW